jgi:hypothetical protein
VTLIPIAGSKVILLKVSYFEVIINLSAAIAQFLFSQWDEIVVVVVVVGWVEERNPTFPSLLGFTKIQPNLQLIFPYYALKPAKEEKLFNNILRV